MVVEYLRPPINSSVKGRKAKRRKLILEQKNNPDFGLFFSSLSIDSPTRDGLHRPALVSQSGVVMSFASASYKNANPIYGGLLVGIGMC
jgi:hypothetical protein